MKKSFLIFSIFLLIISCKKEPKKPVQQDNNTSNYMSFGDQISEDNSLSAADMMLKYNALKAGDTINVKFASNINELCSKKGCWMKLDLGKDSETMVRFKDYGFFMPLDSKGKEVIVEGKAFVKEVSVKDLRHYAEDAGKSKDEIAKITEPKLEFAFEAHGVLMKK